MGPGCVPQAHLGSQVQFPARPQIMPALLCQATASSPATGNRLSDSPITLPTFSPVDCHQSIHPCQASSAVAHSGSLSFSSLGDHPQCLVPHHPPSPQFLISSHTPLPSCRPSMVSLYGPKSHPSSSLLSQDLPSFAGRPRPPVTSSQSLIHLCGCISAFSSRSSLRSGAGTPQPGGG